MSPRDAFFAEYEVVARADAIGRISAELVAPYPPGVPVLVPGEEVTVETLEALELSLRAGNRIAYAADPTLDVAARRQGTTQQQVARADDHPAAAAGVRVAQ